jgi:hypothetical protein
MAHMHMPSAFAAHSGKTGVGSRHGGCGLRRYHRPETRPTKSGTASTNQLSAVTRGGGSRVGYHHPFGSESWLDPPPFSLKRNPTDFSCPSKTRSKRRHSHRRGRDSLCWMAGMEPLVCKEEGEFSASLAPRKPVSGCIAGVPREPTTVRSCWTWVKRAFILPISKSHYNYSGLRYTC